MRIFDTTCLPRQKLATAFTLKEGRHNSISSNIPCSKYILHLRELWHWVLIAEALESILNVWSIYYQMVSDLLSE